MSSSLVCPECEYPWDTPNHEWGCALGRKSYGHDDWYPEFEEDEDGEYDDLDYPHS